MGGGREGSGREVRRYRFITVGSRVRLRAAAISRNRGERIPIAARRKNLDFLSRAVRARPRLHNRAHNYPVKSVPVSARRRNKPDVNRIRLPTPLATRYQRASTLLPNIPGQRKDHHPLCPFDNRTLSEHP